MKVHKIKHTLPKVGKGVIRVLTKSKKHTKLRSGKINRKLQRELNKDFKKLFYEKELRSGKIKLGKIKKQIQKYVYSHKKTDKIKFEGKEYNYWQLFYHFQNEAKLINNKISEYSGKLKVNRFKKFKHFKKIQDDKSGHLHLSYLVMKREQAEKDVMGDVGVDKFNGLSKKKDADRIIHLFDEIFTSMESKDILVITFDPYNSSADFYMVTDNENKFKELYKRLDRWGKK